MRNIALLISFGVGFLSLSQEIVWVRIVSFSQQGRPHAFSLVLVVFLVGIAAGSMIGRRVCARSTDVLRSAALALVLAAAFDLASMLAYSTSNIGANVGSHLRLTAVLLLVGIGAALKGILFPIVHHLGTDSAAGHVGRSVSHVYLGNVMGSTLGPIVTGFWLLDFLPVEAVFALIALGTSLLGIVAFWACRRPVRDVAWSAHMVVLVLAVFVLTTPPSIILRIAANERADPRIKQLLQNKHGIIHMVAEDKPGTGDITLGGNIYDGRVNVAMAVNSNQLDRAYVMAAIHPRPRSALVVGLSSGAWAAVILGIPGIESLDIVEINPGYLDIIKAYPQVAPLLTDPRVHIHIDDGRRWLRSHPDKRYDLIFQNTSYHWRAYMTLLLSKEYLEELRRHLNGGGIVAANTTGSQDAYLTASTVFAHSGRHLNFMYMSDAALVKRPDAEEVLRRATIWGQPAFHDGLFGPEGIARKLAFDPIESTDALFKRVGGPRVPMVISDLNMVTEYRHGREPPFAWMRALLPADAGPLQQ